MAVPNLPFGVLPPSQLPMVAPAGSTGQPMPQPGSNATGFQGFPNFNVPFPYLNLPQQLQASMQTPRDQSYGRFGTGTNPGVGTLPQLPQLPSQAQVPFQPPTGLPQLPGTQPPGSVSAGNLPTQGAATGFPGLGMPSTSGSGYEAMKAGTLGQIADMRRARMQTQTAQQPNLQQFASTFNSLPTDAEKFVYWNSQPSKGMYDPFVNSLPDFRGWVNNMFNNYNGGSLAGAKWDPLLGQIRS